MARTLTWVGTALALSAAATALGQFAGPSIQLQGKIDRFTLSPAGSPDGFFLDTGVEVHFHRYLGRQLGAALKRGELVKVQGTHLAAEHLVLASSVTDLINHETVADKGEVGLPPSAVLPPGASGSSEGLVRALLHGSQGQVDGALLDNDVMVRLPDNVGAILPNLLVVGRNLAVQGQEVDTENGRLIRIESMGPSANELTPVQPGAQP
jgi:hypothetical protein